MIGFVNISVEPSSVAGQKWQKRFCVLKHGRLDCYKDPLDDNIEFSTTVAGASLDLSDKSAKRDLAVKISLNGREIFLEVSVEVLFKLFNVLLAMVVLL